ncbi:MAG: putative biosynthetic protein (TIGR04098 family) [Pseudohongiellaceae bacterium]|jgi:probable biosynthetic protein (TIGR04098 family)
MTSETAGEALSAQLTIGMPHMVPGQLSEVELLKFVGDLQWQSMGAALETAPHQVVNDGGERLLASFINIESHFGDGCLAQFQEGDQLTFSGRSAFFAKQFVEGTVVFAKDADELQQTQDSPRIEMTNALVTKSGSNTQLKTSRPAGMHQRTVPEVRNRPRGMVEHSQVQTTGQIPHQAQHETATALRPRTTDPIVYSIQPDSDLNGAGLVYFARYIAMMNFAERESLRGRLHRPFSTPLAACLSTRTRRTFYFANAEASDKIEIHCKAWLLDKERERTVASTKIATFLFDYQLYRQSDGVLMASSLAERCLIVPNSQKGLQAEASRFFAELG